MIVWHYLQEYGYPMFCEGTTVPCIVKVRNSLTEHEYIELAYCEYRRNNPNSGDKCFVSLEEGIPIEDISTVYAWERISDIAEYLDEVSQEENQ